MRRARTIPYADPLTEIITAYVRISLLFAKHSLLYLILTFAPYNDLLHRDPCVVNPRKCISDRAIDNSRSAVGIMEILSGAVSSSAQCMQSKGKKGRDMTTYLH